MLGHAKAVALTVGLPWELRYRASVKPVDGQSRTCAIAVVTRHQVNLLFVHHHG